MGIKIANNASTTIQAAVFATDTVVTVTGGSGSLSPLWGRVTTSTARWSAPLAASRSLRSRPGRAIT